MTSVNKLRGLFTRIVLLLKGCAILASTTYQPLVMAEGPNIADLQQICKNVDESFHAMNTTTHRQQFVKICFNRTSRQQEVRSSDGVNIDEFCTGITSRLKNIFCCVLQSPTSVDIANTTNCKECLNRTLTCHDYMDSTNDTRGLTTAPLKDADKENPNGGGHKNDIDDSMEENCYLCLIRTCGEDHLESITVGSEFKNATFLCTEAGVNKNTLQRQENEASGIYVFAYLSLIAGVLSGVAMFGMALFCVYFYCYGRSETTTVTRRPANKDRLSVTRRSGTKHRLSGTRRFSLAFYKDRYKPVSIKIHNQKK